MIPPARVLAAVDFSESSRLALTCAARLARDSGAELHAVHAANQQLCAAVRARRASLTAEIREELIRFTTATLPDGNATPRHHVVCGEAPQVIRDIAHRESCDVVVVGAHGLSSNDRSRCGATAEALLREIDIPMLVVPNDWALSDTGAHTLAGIGPVIVGLDFTCPSIDAAATGAKLAARLNTSLRLVHIVTPLQAPARWRADIEGVAKRQFDEAVARIAHIQAALKAIVSVEVQTDIGDVAPALADLAHAMPTAILVLGRASRSREYGPPGTIASRVLARDRPPLLLQIPMS